MRNDEALSADMLETVSGGNTVKETLPLGGAVNQEIITQAWGGGPISYIKHQVNNFYNTAHRSMVEFSKTPEFKAMQRAAQRPRR